MADGTGVGYGPSKPVEFGHHEGVAGPDGGERLVEARTLAVRAGEAVVEIDPFLGHAELGEALALRGEVLGIGGAAGVVP